jgi:phosphodiesterase/alkaline phosphatase D-like protein
MYLRVLNKSYPTKRKDSKGMQALKEKFEARSNFCRKAYYEWIPTF